MIGIDLAGRAAIVTGAARGIGAEIARRFAAAGAGVLLGDVLDDQGEAVAAEIRAGGGQAEYLHHDVADEPAWEAAVARCLDRFGGLDVLVNNAGIEQTVFLADLDVAAARQLLDVNVLGVLIGHKHAIRAMRPGGPAGRGGSIVNLSSVAGLVGTPGLGTYSASKGGVRLLSKAAAVECGQLGYGIRVNSVHPALVNTEMGNKLVGDLTGLGIFPDLATAQAHMQTLYPIGRTGEPPDIADVVLFLGSDLSRWMTGTELVVDGGMTAV
ncbi:glucose 1-dehydrogenase [Marinibaculum pumilum]|uniref:Glucose 1-dehydrogenase n=1 Tax=Marinibaculum pumilum TaxID=1766165 RepID=A0ABV7KZK1_9PROT